MIYYKFIVNFRCTSKPVMTAQSFIYLHSHMYVHRAHRSMITFRRKKRKMLFVIIWLNTLRQRKLSLGDNECVCRVRFVRVREDHRVFEWVGEKQLYG